MRNFKLRLRHYLFVSAIACLLLTASNASAQAPGEIPHDGILSYIFSFRAITVLLITGLVAQIVWRKRRRTGVNKMEVIHEAPASQRQRKKRYDRAQMSSLLKASASGMKNPALDSNAALRSWQPAAAAAAPLEHHTETIEPAELVEPVEPTAPDQVMSDEVMSDEAAPEHDASQAFDTEPAPVETLAHDAVSPN
ncbi:MAG: hypothetical protein JOZ52_14990 [Acidobacteria bacterium]|nr:hypothetical protein [Acidobacteriota bacterium]